MGISWVTRTCASRSLYTNYHRVQHKARSTTAGHSSVAALELGRSALATPSHRRGIEPATDRACDRSRDASCHAFAHISREERSVCARRRGLTCGAKLAIVGRSLARAATRASLTPLVVPASYANTSRGQASGRVTVGTPACTARRSARALFQARADSGGAMRGTVIASSRRPSSRASLAGFFAAGFFAAGFFARRLLRRRLLRGGLLRAPASSPPASSRPAFFAAAFFASRLLRGLLRGRLRRRLRRGLRGRLRCAAFFAGAPSSPLRPSPSLRRASRRRRASPRPPCR